MTSNNTDLLISNILKDLGVTPGLRGYEYLRYAIKLTMETPSIVHNLVKGLYPAVAKHFNTTISAVERNMRHAIEFCWLCGNMDVQNELFRNSVDTNKDFPVNKAFIATVADYLLLTEGGRHGSR